jgi:hypothetical protein
LEEFIWIGSIQGALTFFLKVNTAREAPAVKFIKGKKRKHTYIHGHCVSPMGVCSPAKAHGGKKGGKNNLSY